MNDNDNLKRDPAFACAWTEWLTVKGVEGFKAYAWTPTAPTAVLGLSQSAERELRLDNLKADNIPVLRRASGGGAVILTEGVLCFGVIASIEALGEDSGIRKAFQVLTSHAVGACRSLGVDADFAGISDIAARSKSDSSTIRKLAGCAQFRKKKSICVHASLLVNTDINIFERYLAFPSEVPDYRIKRSHSDFCRSLSDMTARRVEVGEVLALIKDESDSRGWEWTDLPDTLEPEADWLLTEKYRSTGWNMRRERPKT